MSERPLTAAQRHLLRTLASGATLVPHRDIYVLTNGSQSFAATSVNSLLKRKLIAPRGAFPAAGYKITDAGRHALVEEQ